MRKLRTLAAILAVTLAFSAVGCGKDDKKGDSKAPTKASEVIKNSYSAVEIGELPDMEYLDNVVKLGDTGKFLVSGYDDSKMVLFITDSEFIDYQDVDISEFSDKHEAYSAVPLVMADGSVYLIVTYTDYEEGTVIPDENDPDFDWENFDYEALDAATLTSYYIYKLDENGEITAENEIKDIEKYAGNDSEGGRIWLGNANALGSDTIIFSLSGMIEESYIAVGTDGKVIGKLDLGDDVYLYNGAVNDKDGNLLFSSYMDNEEVIAKIDVETMTLSDDKISFGDEAAYINGLYRGNEQYPILAAASNALYGITEDNKLEEIINWVDSDVTGDSVRGVFPVENGEYIIYVNDWNTNEQGFYRLTERDPSELENAVIINMVVSYTDSATTEMVRKFNQENTDYRIRVEEYGKYYEWDEETETNTNTPAKQLQTDLAAGKDVDIIVMNDAALIQNLGKKGVLADMYDFMGKDGAPAKEDFIESALKGMETDGKLYAMPINFSISTFAVKSKYFSEENWTIDDFIETYDKMPEGCSIYQYNKNTKQSVFNLLAESGSDFLDYKNGTCSFNSPDFIKILEFANQFEMESEEDDGIAVMDDQENWYSEQELALRNDKALLYNVYLDEPREYKRARDGYFGEDITLVGRPSANGAGAQMTVNDSIMIMDDSASKDACWKFVSQFLTEEYQSGNNVWSTPVLKSAFEKKLEDLKGKPYWIDEDGKKEEYDDMVYIGDKEIKIEPYTQEEVDFIRDYILNAKFTSYYYDDEIQSIINEEVNAYFAGEKSAEEAADIIQNRVSILISEKS